MIVRLAVLCGLIAFPLAADAAPEYAHEIAPILRTYCSGCHNDRDAEAEFSVERFATLRKGGAGSGDPIVPGDAAGSVLVQRIKSADSDHMPPDDEPQVPAADLATLEAWIAAGAPGPAADTSILESLAVPRLPASRGPRPVTALAVSPDGTRLAVARGRTVEVFAEPDAGGAAAAPLLEITDLPGPIAAVHSSRDGSRLVLAGGIAGLRGARTGRLLRSYGGHRDVVYDAELSPDETTLATAGYDRSIKLWNVADGSLIRSIDVHNGAIFDLAWHPSGKALASASADETVKLWRAGDGVRLDTLSQPQGEVTSVAFTPDGGHLVAAGRDKRIHLWRLVAIDQPAINPAVHARFAHEAPITALVIAPDGTRLVTTAEDRTVKAWSLPDLVLLAELPRQPDLVAAAVAGGGGVLLGRMDGALERLAVGGPAAAATATAPATQAVAAATPETSATVADIAEAEPNDTAATATAVPVPAALRGSIGAAGDAD